MWKSSKRWKKSKTRLPRSGLEKAKKKYDNAEVGDYLVDGLPPIDFGRIAAQTAKQVIVQRVREAERSRQYDEYKDRIGEVVNGLVKRIEYGNVVVDLGRAEAMLRRDESIPREHFNTGDRVRSYILDVPRRSPRPADFPVAHASAISCRPCFPRKCRKFTTASSK